LSGNVTAPAGLGRRDCPSACPNSSQDALLTKWIYCRSARVWALAIPAVESPSWSIRGTAGCTRTGGMGAHVPGAVSLGRCGLLTAALSPGKVIPLSHQGPAVVAGVAIRVIPLSQQRPVPRLIQILLRITRSGSLDLLSLATSCTTYGAASRMTVAHRTGALHLRPRHVPWCDGYGMFRPRPLCRPLLGLG
jgi:hypothetical protein